MIAILLLAATGAQAQESWLRLRQGELNNALSAHRLRLEDGATQSFGEDGFTRRAAEVSQRGHWKIDGDKLCTAWPPAEGWTCYRVFVSGDRKRLRFLDDVGAATVGTYMSR
ncbi:hypothetical protein [Defluviimonas sp. WL0075]|uniref:Dihydrodipicolinate reductase n=1 Tax=Albidovulum sediminicola TaxID=2984331 RepID=A0ABT2Z2J5_9RHOB|nr:hypothetical protein [Defluviimonas sp. WL0075]MCV2865349.1 hypothetical protein [Defluviimonas sp. WL0075]